ncbi:MAG: prolyl oligopeptidase family serine peptidase [Burkholderiales bacterium]
MPDSFADDPYLWLEDVTGDASLAFARERNARTLATLGTGEFTALEQRIRAFLDSDTRIPAIAKHGPWFYNFWQDAQHPRGLWRRTTLAEYRREAPAWEIVLDLDALGAAEGENWVWQGAEFLRPACRRCLVRLSRGGADAAVVREFDVAAKAFVSGGFVVPEAKSNVHWRDEDSVFVATDFGPGSQTASGYPRIVKVWSRGTPLGQARTVFEGVTEDVWVSGWRDRTPGFERDVIMRGTTFYTSETYVLHDAGPQRIPVPDSAVVSLHRDLAFVWLRKDWESGGTTHPAGALLATDVAALMAGTPRFAVLFAPTERTSLAAFEPTRHHVIVNELHEVKSRLVVLTRDGDTWRRAPLPGMPAFGTVAASAVDPDEGDDYLATVTDFVTPTQLFHGTAGGGAPERLKALPAAFDASALAVTQHHAVSADGTRVPYFEVARRDLVHDGRNPTVINGYGGFEVPLLPAYSATAGMGWLARGGVYVVANIRGGGEFGPRWHEAALRERRPRAYEDFIAVAEDLVRRQVTTPAHLGATGGSNGGLLMGNMLTRRPDLFGAIVCHVPLLDMRRYHLLLAGASWVAEYGDPDNPDDWAFLRTFSPYHNLRDDVRYPPFLLMTSTRDDRVHPGHARKMAARMQEAGHDVLYFENIEGGHGGAADNAQMARMYALQYTFLWSRLA